MTRLKFCLLLSAKLQHSGSFDIYIMRVGKLAALRGWNEVLEVDRAFRERLPRERACDPNKSLDDLFLSLSVWTAAEKNVERKSPVPKAQHGPAPGKEAPRRWEHQWTRLS
jgi:hypothetical protein